jgi:hypothetical protein
MYSMKIFSLHIISIKKYIYLLAQICNLDHIPTSQNGGWTDFTIFSATIAHRKAYRLIPLSTPVDFLWTIRVSKINLLTNKKSRIFVKPAYYGTDRRSAYFTSTVSPTLCSSASFIMKYLGNIYIYIFPNHWSCLFNPGDSNYRIF